MSAIAVVHCVRNPQALPPRLHKLKFIRQLRSAEEHDPESGHSINVKYVYYVHTSYSPTVYVEFGLQNRD